MKIFIEKGFQLFFLSLLIAVVQASCTPVLVVEKVKPPEVNIFPSQWKVVAVNRYNPDLVTSTEDAKEKEVIRLGALEAFFGAVDTIIEDSTFSMVHYDSAVFTVRRKGEALNRDQIREIYQQHPNHLLLSLDDFEVDMKKETDRIVYDDGSVTNVIYYTLQASSAWTLYDSLGNMMDQAKVSEEDLYQTRPVIFGLVTSTPTIVNAPKEVRNIAWFTGNSYWKRLRPQKLSYSRPYYKSNNLKEAAKKMTENQWQEAINLLEPKSLGRSKQAARACFNIAVAYEALDQIDQAKYFATEAIRKKNSLAVGLLEELENYPSSAQ